MKVFTLVLLAVLIPLTCTAKPKSVKIYYVPWSVATSVAMSAGGVRKNAFVTYEILDATYAAMFVKSLGEETMQADPELRVADLRLVIDVVDEDGSISSYYASQFAMVAEKSGKKKLIDESFRSRFTATLRYENGGS